MPDVEAFLRDAAQKRGIDPDIAVRVAKSEGGVDVPWRVGKFATGWSYGPLQLHWGGAGYEQFGTVAGMGNGFTALTGWQPSDERAWRDSIRYGLNRARLSGWTPWYGAAHVGIGKWDGIDTSNDWDAASERWDYETGGAPVPADRVVYDPDEPTITQNDEWSCAPTSARWALSALGRNPAESWMESTMIASGVVSTDDGLLDGSGGRLAAWITAQYGEFGYSAASAASVSFDDVRSVAGSSPVLLGGHGWGSAGHWSGVRRYDPASDTLLLANPGGSGPVYGQQSLDRAQFAERAPWSMVRITHPDLTAAPPSTADPRDARIAALEAQVAGLVSTLSYLTHEVAEALTAATDTLKRHAPAA